jgi:hypothetical protein
MNSVRALLSHVIDYAGLFPPAQLKMPEAVRNYTDYLLGQDEWALGRFIVPVARLPEFEQAVRSLRLGDAVKPDWRLSALGGPELKKEVQTISEFNNAWARRHGDGSPIIDTIELRVATTQEISQAVELIPEGLRAYFEILINTDPGALIESIGRLGTRAKVRTGGIYPEMIPASTDLARFIEHCCKYRVPFKATAGLHHPVRRIRPLTCDTQGPTAVMHGFLNVLLCAAFCYLGVERGELVELLEEQDEQAFAFADGGVSWQGHSAASDDLARVRAGFAMSFGSCLFKEPLDSLRLMNLL